jgi:hypothetical protein
MVGKMAIKVVIENRYLYLVVGIFVFLIGVGLVIGGNWPASTSVWHDAKNVRVDYCGPNDQSPCSDHFVTDQDLHGVIFDIHSDVDSNVIALGSLQGQVVALQNTDINLDQRVTSLESKSGGLMIWGNIGGWMTSSTYAGGEVCANINKDCYGVYRLVENVQGERSCNTGIANSQWTLTGAPKGKWQAYCM